MKIGVDIGGSHIALAVLKDDKVIDKKSIYTRNLDIFTRKNMKQYIFETIIEYVDEKLLEISKEKNSEEKLTMIGISSAGEIQNGIIYNAQNLKIVKFDIKGKLEERYEGVEVKVKNDAISALEAEMKYGNLKQSDTSVFMCIGTGIGFSYIYDNKVFKLHGMYGVDLGHMIIEKDGIQCSCGKKGCFEKYATMRALKRNLKKELQLYEDMKVIEILERYSGENVDKVVEDYISYLIVGIANIIEIFKPKKICIGGSFASLENTIVWKELLKQYEELKIYSKIQKPILTTAKYRNDAGIIGSIL